MLLKAARRVGNTISNILALCLAIPLLTIGACRRQPVVIVYDHAGSVAEGIEHYPCTAEIRKGCEEDVRQGEAKFQRDLSSAFERVPECRGVKFIVDAGANSNNAPEKGDYWKLRVDYGPGLSFQHFTLARGSEKPKIGGESDAEDTMTYVCEMSKNNGMDDWW